ncbi:probable disease resistance protein At1g62630 [Citrus clementina]|uniref:probable disease resistance protein At1g62630 n=1 Tax=Citrus clementina TaxID=85681 RepID=UPI00076386CB|nr:probable disease resistance protein At1g62630 [Citrus x clementina]
MGGIGKTTLVKEFARQASEEKLFDQVVFSEVSQTPDIKKIHGEIAEKLGLEFSEEAESRRASRLYERLKKEKMILVILDNIWKYLDLETVGIPFGDDHRGCKLLLTARDCNVLLSMGSENNFLTGVKICHYAEVKKKNQHVKLPAVISATSEDPRQQQLPA